MRIDWWTLALQTANVLILIWLLGRFFFRPVMDIVARRQDAANKILDDARHARQQAADMRAEVEQMRAKISAERDGIMAQARDAARIETEKQQAQLADELARQRSEAAAAISRDRAAAQSAVIDHASELSVDIARRLLSRVPERSILAAFVEELCREIRALPTALRDGLASATADRPIEVVTAEPLSSEQQQYVGRALKDALGVEPPLAFRSDSSIVGGLELHGQGTIIRNSWSADLERIRQELSGDTHARQP